MKKSKTDKLQILRDSAHFQNLVQRDYLSTATLVMPIRSENKKRSVKDIIKRICYALAYSIFFIGLSYYKLKLRLWKLKENH